MANETDPTGAGGGGDVDGSGDSATVEGQSPRDYVNDFEVTVELPGWLQRFRSTAVAISTNPAAWIISILTSLGFYQAQLELEDHSPLVVLLDFFLFRNVLLPAASALFNSLVSILDTLVIFIFGTDYQVGVTPGSTIGIVDIPVAFAGPIAGGFVSLTGTLTNSIASFNQQVATSLVGAGIAAPALVAGFWVAEIAALAWLTWVILQALTVADVIKSATAPIRNFLKLFIGED